MNSTMNGGRLKVLTAVDEYSRYCWSIKVAHYMTGREVVAELERLITLHGPPGSAATTARSSSRRPSRLFLPLPRSRRSSSSLGLPGKMVTARA
jgi:transposase InsO family protein